MRTKTSYRLKVIDRKKNNIIGDYVFQFLDESTNTWRCVPRVEYPRVYGDYLRPEICPEDIGNSSSEFMTTYMNCESELKDFARKYKDVNSYFIMLQNEHNKHMIKEEKRKNLKDFYL